jgi:hypothetical protein
MNRGTAAEETRFIHLGGMIGDGFGNPVVEITGPFHDDFTSLKWDWKDHRDGGTWTFKAAGYSMRVQDMDGDESTWEVKFRGTKILSGNTDSDNEALAIAESVMRAHLRRQIYKRRQQRSWGEGI